MEIEKIKKITEALYRVTELLSDREPLKWQLRTTALELFDLLISSEEKDFFYPEKTRDLIKKLDCLLQLAYASSVFVSAINFKVLQREYLAAGNKIKETKIPEVESLKGLGIALPNFYSKRESNGQLPVNEIVTDNGHNGQHFNFNGHNGQGEKTNAIEAKNEEIKKIKAEEENPISLSVRKKKILSTLNVNRWATIRDISSSLPEFGEKTIQRDLLKMTDSGILKKTGDKRWRKYSLV